MTRTPLIPALGALLLSAACDGAPTPVTLAAPVAHPAFVLSGDTLMSTDFSEYAPGAQPAGWTQAWDPTPHFVVVDESGAMGGRVLQWSATGQSRNRWALAYDGLGERTDQSVYTEFRVRSLGGGTSAYYMGAAAVRIGGTAADERGYAVFFVTVPSSGAKAVVLSTWSAGAYVQLGSYTTDWQLDAWYSVRLEAVGTTLRARVWPRGEAEPGSWHLSATDTRYASGRPGVSHHDNGTVQWDVWQAAAAPVTTAPGPWPPILVQDHFSAGPAWVPPTGWTETSAPENSSWTLAADLLVPDGRALRNVTTTIGRHILRLDTAPDSVADQEVLVRLWMQNSDARGPGVALRHTMNGSNANAYVAYLRPETDQVEINRFINGQWQFISAGSFPIEPRIWYWLRFRAQGTQVMARVWRSSKPEPTAWTTVATDVGGLATGAAGLYTYEPNTVDYDVVTYASGGATAPPAPPSSAPVVAQVRVTPDSTTVAQGGTVQYAAYGRLTSGDSVAIKSTWSTTGGTITSGGLLTAGLPLGTFSVTATLSGTSTSGVGSVTVQDAPPFADSFSTGFALSPVGVQPESWTETSAPSGVDWTVQPDASVPDGAVLRAVATETARHILRADVIHASSGDQEVLAKVRMGSDHDRGAGVAIRHTMNGSLETAYVAYFRPAINSLEINRFMDGAWHFVAGAAYDSSPETWYWIRFRAEGTTLKVKVWLVGQNEPAAWRIVATDTGIAVGGVGVYTYEPGTVDFDGFSAVRGTGTAATPP
jgi:hypothetical protein